MLSRSLAPNFVRVVGYTLATNFSSVVASLCYRLNFQFLSAVPHRSANKTSAPSDINEDDLHGFKKTLLGQEGVDGWNRAHEQTHTPPTDVDEV